MKTIGLIGGMSWESSLEYYRLLNEAVKKELGSLHSCKCILYSVDFAEIAELQRHGEWAKLEEIMIYAAASLEKAGAELLVICTNTMHKLASAVQEHVGIPLIHVADTAAERIKAEGLKKVGLLGTRFTMEEDFYIKRLKELHDIEVIVPSEDDRKIVHDIIYNELVRGIVRDASKAEYARIIQSLVSKGAEGIILGCTEIFLIVQQKDFHVNIFDTTAIHAEAAVRIALK